MSTIFSTLLASAQHSIMTFVPLLAQAEEEEGRGYNIEVGLVMLCVILGMAIVMRGSRRTTEFKKPKRE